MSDDHTIGSAPIEEKYRKIMRELGQALQEAFNEGLPISSSHTGFVLLVFELGAPKAGRMNYISNSNRKDVVIALKEQVSYFEGMPENVGRG